MQRRARRRVAQVTLALLVGVTARPALATIKIDIGAASGARSGEVSVPITMSQATVAVGGLQVDVFFPQNVLAVADASAVCAVDSGVPGTVYTRLVAVAGTPAGMGRLRVILGDIAGGTYTNRRLLTCTFTVKANAPTGTQALNGTGLVVSKSTGAVVGATLDPGSVTVNPPCTGCC